MSECRELKQLRCETKSGQEEILKILAEEIHKLENRLDALESAKCENCKTKQAEPKDAEETPNASGIEDVILVKIVELKK